MCYLQKGEERVCEGPLVCVRFGWLEQATRSRESPWKLRSQGERRQRSWAVQTPELSETRPWGKKKKQNQGASTLLPCQLHPGEDYWQHKGGKRVGENTGPNKDGGARRKCLPSQGTSQPCVLPLDAFLVEKGVEPDASSLPPPCYISLIPLPVHQEVLSLLQQPGQAKGWGPPLSGISIGRGLMVLGGWSQNCPLQCSPFCLQNLSQADPCS